MDSSEQYDQTRVEFEEEWSRNDIEALLKTNDYPRAREERALYERFLLKGELILEAGCGLGPKVIYFREQGHRIVGVDFVFSALSRLKHFRTDLQLACADVHHCPFPDDTFGAYLSYGVVEHFPDGPDAAIREARRILKPGGVLLMMVPADNFLSRFIHNPDNVLQRLRTNPWVRRIAGKPALDGSHEHDLYMKLHSKQEMRKILQAAGFHIEVEAPVSHSFSLFMLCECFQRDTLGQTTWAAEWIAAMLKKIAPWHTANHLLFVARK